MTLRTPLVLLVIAVALLAYVLAFERGRPSPTEIEARSGLLLEALIPERISRIRIASGEQRVVLRREGEGFDETWRLEQPEEAPADSEAIEDYLRAWQFALPVRTLGAPTPEDLHAFGMDAPRAEVTFEMGPATLRVSLGSGEPVDGGGYVRIGDTKAVAVIGDDVVALFDRAAESFEARTDGGIPLLLEPIGADAGPNAPAPDP